MTDRPIVLQLPWPPSVNRYWRRVGKRTVLSRAARLFRKRVWDVWFVQKYVFGWDGFGGSHVALRLVLHPPDGRRRDLDNVLKAVFDALEHAKIIENDAQIRKLNVEFAEIRGDGGSILLSIGKLEKGNAS